MTVIKPRLRRSRRYLRASAGSIHRRARGSAGPVSPPQPTCPRLALTQASRSSLPARGTATGAAHKPGPAAGEAAGARGPQLRGRPSPAERGGSGGAERRSRPAVPALLRREGSAVPAPPRPAPSPLSRSVPTAEQRAPERPGSAGRVCPDWVGTGAKLELRAFGAGQRVRGGHPVPGVGGRLTERPWLLFGRGVPEAHGLCLPRTGPRMRLPLLRSPLQRLRALGRPPVRALMNLRELVSALNDFAPPSLAESWDNVGLLVEPSPPHTVNTLFLTNDLTEEVMEEAVQKKADLVLSYHPPIFTPLKRVTWKTWKERLVVRALENRIGIYSPHTAYDAVPHGVNNWLAKGLGEILLRSNKLKLLKMYVILGGIFHHLPSSFYRCDVRTVFIFLNVFIVL